MNRRLLLLLILSFALVAGSFYYYTEQLRPFQLEEKTWTEYLAAGKWIAQLNGTEAATIIGDSHIIELDFGELNEGPVQGIAYRGATSLLLNNLAEQVENLETDLGIIMLGTNDVLFGIDTTLASRRWDKLLDSFANTRNADIFLVNLPPISVSWGLFTSPRDVDKKVAAYNQMLLSKARRNGIYLIDFHTHMLASSDPEKCFKSDGIHLNELGYQMLVALINETLD